MKNNDWKDRLNVVYSTNPDYQYENIGEEEAETLPKNQQKLRISMEKKGRGGKTVTLVKGFIGTEDDLKELGKLLKTKCGVGGSAKEGEIIIQGDFKQRIIDLFKAEGYTQTKKKKSRTLKVQLPFYFKMLNYSARKVKRLKAVIFNSASAAFKVSLTVFLPSKISS